MNSISSCPFCQEELVITAVRCGGCQTSIQGEFKATRFQRFDSNDLLFIELFLKNEGQIKQMEKDLGISYPTVKNRLKSIVAALGYSNPANEPPSERSVILADLSAGLISVEEAIGKLGRSE